jgi:hypothetical protein
LDQTRAKMRFKRADLPRDRRLGDAALLRHSRERADFGDTQESAKCSNKIHGSYPQYQAL